MRTVNELPHRQFPCAECPWRKDTSAGQFPQHRYEALERTVGCPGEEAGIYAPMFACYKSAEGQEQACAGWLAVSGIYHLGVRLAVASGNLDAAVLTPGTDWPELFSNYADVMRNQAATS